MSSELSCEFCQKIFKSKQGLSKHKNICKQNHTDESQNNNNQNNNLNELTCEFCKKEFSTKHTLTKHKTTCEKYLQTIKDTLTKIEKEKELKELEDKYKNDITNLEKEYTGNIKQIETKNKNEIKKLEKDSRSIISEIEYKHKQELDKYKSEYENLNYKYNNLNNNYIELEKKYIEANTSVQYANSVASQYKHCNEMLLHSNQTLVNKTSVINNINNTNNTINNNNQSYNISVPLTDDVLNSVFLSATDSIGGNKLIEPENLANVIALKLKSLGVIVTDKSRFSLQYKDETGQVIKDHKGIDMAKKSYKLSNNVEMRKKWKDHTELHKTIDSKKYGDIRTMQCDMEKENKYFKFQHIIGKELQKVSDCAFQDFYQKLEKILIENPFPLLNNINNLGNFLREYYRELEISLNGTRVTVLNDKKNYQEMEKSDLLIILTRIYNEMFYSFTNNFTKAEINYIIYQEQANRSSRKYFITIKSNNAKFKKY
jgi:hypothetical protein